MFKLEMFSGRTVRHTLQRGDTVEVTDTHHVFKTDEVIVKTIANSRIKSCHKI